MAVLDEFAKFALPLTQVVSTIIGAMVMHVFGPPLNKRHCGLMAAGWLFSNAVIGLVFTTYNIYGPPLTMEPFGEEVSCPFTRFIASVWRHAFKDDPHMLDPKNYINEVAAAWTVGLMGSTLYLVAFIGHLFAAKWAVMLQLGTAFWCCALHVNWIVFSVVEGANLMSTASLIFNGLFFAFVATMVCSAVQTMCGWGQAKAVEIEVTQVKRDETKKTK